MIRICEQCRQEFHGKRRNRFCSWICYMRHRVPPPTDVPDWIDTTVWRPGRGGNWYKRGNKCTYVIKVCERCGASYLGQPPARFCSVACARGGDGKGYAWAHKLVQREKGPARDYGCADCDGQATEWSYDGLDSDELVEPEAGMRYSLNPDHYQPRCHGCHTVFDGHFGEGNGRAKLTDAQCREIRTSLSAGATQQELADLFGVSQGHISRIKRGLRSGGAAAQMPEAAPAEAWLRQIGGDGR